MVTKRRVDLVLVHPANRLQIYQGLASRLAAVEPPVWAGMIATFIRNSGFSVCLIDADAEDLTPAQTAERIDDLAPLLVAVVVYGHQPSASTQNVTAAGAICTAVKQRLPHLKILLLGGHVAALPERTLQEEDADFVCGGEGPYTTLELLHALKSDRSNAHEKARSLWYRQNGGIHSTPSAPLIKDLDQTLPAIAWDLLPMDKYRAHNWHCFGHLQRQPYAALYTTLGCPYHCSFCCIQAPFKSGEKQLGYKPTVNSYRFWSPQSVVAQIDHLVTNYGIRNIKIADEMFVLNPSHVTRICDLLVERDYKLNIWAYARIDTVKPALLTKLKRAGFNWLAFGIESGHERVRNNVDKSFDAEDIVNTIAEVRAAGINVIGNYMFGLPEDYFDSMQATLDLALSLNCEFANFYCAMAYPGSRLFDMALQEGWSLPKTWTGYAQHAVDALPVPTKYLSAADVLRFRDYAFQVYFNNSDYLDMITREFGAETTRHIRDMASHNLVRHLSTDTPRPDTHKARPRQRNAHNG